MENKENASFRGVLSFKPFIDYLNARFSDPEEWQSFGSPDLGGMLRDAPELGEPIRDLGLLDTHADIVSKLMGFLFSPGMWETDMTSVVIPFSTEFFFHSSPPFNDIFLDNSGKFTGRLIGEEALKKNRVTRYYLFVIEKLFGVRHRFDYPLVFAATDRETGLDRYYKIEFDSRFVTVDWADGSPPVSDETKDRILAHCSDPDALRKMIPPENFEVRGITIMRAHDVTESKVLLALERDLIDQYSIISKDGFLRLQERLRIYFRRNDLVASLAGIQDENVLMLNSGCDLTHKCLFTDSLHVPVSKFRGTALGRAFREEKTLTVGDLRTDPDMMQFGSGDNETQLRSAIIAPLVYQTKSIGALIIKTTRPGDFGPIDILLMDQLKPLFTLGINRALEDLDNSVQAVIKNKCTAIHPTVEWRFYKAAVRHMENRRAGHHTEIEPIIFRGVYPLYSSSDIRGSTQARNLATKLDISEHLKLASDIIEAAHKVKPMLIFRELSARISRHLNRIETRIGTSDEMSVVRFLIQEVESVFPHLREFGPEVGQAIESYIAAIDPNVGTVYRVRKEFEESVSLLNSRLATYIDRENAEMQKACPHYFERHRTDGVDYLVYVGESLLENGGFNMLYLSNLRLWQIQVACGMAWHTEKVKPSLKVPLDTAHLILVQNTSLSLRFRFDEKRFGVDGAYDTKHEIIKSRIDKAAVKETNERLTQPGRVAIVYSHPEEAEEMRRHIDFLIGEKFLKNDVESLDLGDLPGVQGLRALRVSVDLASPVLAQRAKGMTDQD